MEKPITTMMVWFVLLMPLVGCVGHNVKSESTDQFRVEEDGDESSLTTEMSESGGSSWEKGVKGAVTVKVEPQSAVGVRLYEWVTYFPNFWDNGYRLFHIAHPGTSIDFTVSGGSLKFDVPGRRHLSSSDVPGGFDAHWEGVWLTLRHR